MNRLRRKSDARSRPKKAANADGDPSANLGSNGSTTPAGEPPSVQLPNAEEFRTSLILPNLMRRFSLLRGQDGQLVDLQTIQNHLAIQRQTGRLTAYEVDAVLEQYKLQSGIESTASSPSLPKRKRIDWSLVEDEAAFLDSLSQTPSSSSTSFVTVNDETQSSLASSITRPRVPAPPVPSDLGLSATFLPSRGSSGLDSSSPPASARSIPLSRESSSGGASNASQGYPYRVKRGTNGLFGGRALDARELKMLRSTSGHSLEASPPSTEGPAGDGVGNEVELDRAPATTALSPAPSMESSEPHPQTSLTDSSAPSTTARDDDDEEPTTSAGHPAGPSTAVLADSPTTPLSAHQLRRISTALEAIEVELAKTFTRMSWTAEPDEGEDDIGARDPTRAAEEEGVEAQVADHSPQAEEAAADAAEERHPAFDGRRSADVESTSPLGVPDSRGDEIGSATPDEYRLFDMSRASDDTVPPSPISPVTDSDLRGVGTFEAAAAPRSEFEAMTDGAAAASDVEELDQFWSRTAAGARSSERTTTEELSPGTDEDQAAAAVGGSTQDPGDALAPTSDNEDEAGRDHVVPLRQPRAVAGPASSARGSLARESFASFRSTGSSFHPVDDARLYSDEDFGLAIAASQNSALQSEIDAFSSQLQSDSGSSHAEPRPRRLSALAIDTSAPARPASLPFDRRPTEELLQVLAAATKRLSASGADKDLYLTHEDVLAIQARLVRNAVAQKAAPIEANVVEGEGTTEDLPAPIADVSDESLNESARLQEEASEDEVVKRLAGLGLDDFASTDFTQPSPQQANAGVFAAGTAESSPGSSAEKPSPISYLRSPASVSMAAQNSQRTYDSNVTFSSAPSGVTTSPSDAFEYSSLVTSRTDKLEHGTPPSVLAADSGTAQTGPDDVESCDASNAFAFADDPSRSGETLPASDVSEVEAESEAPTRDSATVEPHVKPSVEPSTVESSTAAESPQRVPRTTPAPDRSGATSILVRDVRNQATLATNALKQHETGASPPRLLRKKSVRKQSISSPHLVSGPINIPAVPIASPKIIAEARSAFANAATEDSPSALRRTRSVSDSKSKGIGSRFKRLLSKREGGSRPDADADTAANTTRPSSRPARPSRAGADPITPPNQSTARFGSPQQSSPQTPSTIMSSPGGSTPRSSPRKKPVPSNVFPSKRSSLSQSHPSSPETTTNGDSRESRHARNQSFSHAFETLPEVSASDAVPETVDDPQHLERSVSFTRVEPLSPRRTESRQDSSRTRSPTSPSTFRSGADRSARFSRDSVESMLRFRQAAEGLGLDPDKVQELVSSAYAYAGSSSHAYSGSISSSNDGNTTLDNHDDSWGRYRQASHGSNATAAAQTNDRAREAHVHLHDAVSDASASAEPGPSSSFGQSRHLSSLSRSADAGFAPPSMLAVPDRSGTLDSLAGPRSPGVESTTSRQSSSGYASSFLDYYAHEEGETDNEGPFNLSTGSTFDPRGDASIRFSVADSADAQPASARVSGTPSGEVVWQVLDDLRTNRFSIASQGSSLGFGSHDSSNGADDPALVDQLPPVATLLRHRDRKRSSASMSSEWDRGRYPSVYLREEQALIELAQQGGIAVDESGRFLVRPKIDAPAVPPLPAEYRDQAHVIDSPAAQSRELPDINRSTDATPTHLDASRS